MTRRQKRTLIRVIVSFVLLIAASLLPVSGWGKLAVSLVPYLIIGWDVLWKAVRNILHGQVFDENFLMAIATVGALILGQYSEAAGVMLFYQVGELFQSFAVGKSRASISALMDIRPDYANIQRDGALVQVDPEEVTVGDEIVVQPGEKVPLDGVVTAGSSTLDTAALTGESVPREVTAGDEITSGCINMTGLLHVKVTKVFGESTVAKILDLVENSSTKKAKAENFITTFARYYTPCVCIAAALLAVVPPLFFHGMWSDWVYRALLFLVISCPCALVISIPLSFFGGIGGASRAGILVKGGNYLEVLAKTGIVVFDKTGTLTKGTFRVTQVCPASMDENQLVELAALAESYSNHPISRSLKEACAQPLDASRVSGVEELPGHGVKATVDGHTVAAGNSKLMALVQAEAPQVDHPGTVVYVAVDGVYAGYILISDEVKPDAAQAISQLRALGVKKTVMLTGDNQAAGEAVAAQLGLDEVHAGLLPTDKVAQVERLLKEKQPGEKLVFVGDGINDAPVLTLADLGIAMGAMGSDAAIEAADVVLMDDKPSKIATAIKISKKALHIVRENIIFALVVKAACLALGALGMANMWEAVFADVGVSVIAILNACRMLRTKS